ncbi:MAG TPA: hypothetical protein ENK57_15020 [Polyangiaceae bacterium]|nr:hypothetical protein [Polyangiaceae bacterium]
MTDVQTAAFHRLLTDAHQGGQAKVDAMVALVQRTVHVVPWPGGIEGYRTLINSDGVAALPIFSMVSELEEAARRFGWLEADGTAPRAEVGARRALNYAIEQDLAFVVIDIASDHSLEAARPEFEPLLSAAARRDSQGPYAAAGKISSSLIRAVTPRPGTVPAARRIEAPTSESSPGILSAMGIPPAAKVPEIDPVPNNDTPGFTVRQGFDPNAGATFGGGSSVAVSAFEQAPGDTLYAALTTVLRGFPEVEWAALCNVARGPSAPVPGVGLRVDVSFRQRLNEIIAEVRAAGERHGAGLDVFLLDDPTLMRAARAAGVFYPWRKK